MVLADAVEDEALDLVEEGSRKQRLAGSPGLELRGGTRVLQFFGPGLGVRALRRQDLGRGRISTPDRGLRTLGLGGSRPVCTVLRHG
jgi:hypothetical protein